MAQPSGAPDIPQAAVMRPRIVAEVSPPKIPAYPEISAQMIFTPGRALGVATASADGPPALVGVAAMGARVSTVLRTSDGVDHVAEVGAEVAGWRVVSATEDHAVLQRGGATVSVKFGGGATARPSSIPLPTATAAPADRATPPPLSGATP
jgi:hypothetical protein